MAKKSPDKTQKTNAARLLDRAGVAYRLVPYPVDEADFLLVVVDKN